MVKELSQPEFESTVDASMRLLEENDTSCQDIPILEYAEQCLGVIGLDGNVDDIELHYAYMNDKGGFCHVGLNWGDENMYLVIVIDMNQKSIIGYSVLNFS